MLQNQINQGQNTPINIPGCLQKNSPQFALGIHGSKQSRNTPEICETPTNKEFKDSDKNHKPHRRIQYKIRSEIQKSNIFVRGSRVEKCGDPISKILPVKESMSNGSIKVGAIETCGSVWNCPVCRTKILRKRQESLSEINDTWISARKDETAIPEFIDDEETGYLKLNPNAPGGHIYMLTLTAPHKKSDRLKDIVGFSKSRVKKGKIFTNQGMSGALCRLKSGRWWQDFKKEISYFADVRVIETTYGDNGWHVHFHMLLYLKGYIDDEYFKKRIFDRWKIVCGQAGLKEPKLDSSGRGAVDLRGAKNLDSYLVKWNTAGEITGIGKKGKQRSISMAELELLTIVDDLSIDLKLNKELARELSQIEAKKLLFEYYTTFKGKKLMTWGGKHKELKAVYCIEQYKEQDSELAKMDKKDNRTIAALDSKVYKKLQKDNNYTVFISAWETSGIEGARRYLKSRYNNSSGIITDEKTLKKVKELEKRQWKQIEEKNLKKVNINQS